MTLSQRDLVTRLRRAFNRVSNPAVRMEDSQLFFRELGMIFYLANTHNCTTKHVLHNLGPTNRQRLEEISKGKLPRELYANESAHPIQNSVG